MARRKRRSRRSSRPSRSRRTTRRTRRSTRSTRRTTRSSRARYAVKCGSRTKSFHRLKRAAVKARKAGCRVVKVK